MLCCCYKHSFILFKSINPIHWKQDANTIEFGEIPHILQQAEQAGKLGRQKLLHIIFLYPNTEINNLHHMLENTR